ncbi:hypothetical protein EJD97_006984, partial [Solanum chilense]
QQYREKDLRKSYELISHLLVAEQNNNLLMKNHENRFTISEPLPEVNEVNVHHARRGKGCGPNRDRGRSRDYGQEKSLKMKEKNPEANFISENQIDITHFDVAYFFAHPEGKIDHLIGDGSVNMEE